MQHVGTEEEEEEEEEECRCTWTDRQMWTGLRIGSLMTLTWCSWRPRESSMHVCMAMALVGMVTSNKHESFCFTIASGMKSDDDDDDDDGDVQEEEEE